MPETHLITGVTGQDGVLLARLLLASGRRVVGTFAPDGIAGPGPGPTACYLDGVVLVEHDVRDTDGFAALVGEHRPAVVHNLAALSSVGDSWDQAGLVDEVNRAAVEGMLAVLAAGLPTGPSAPAFVQASSSEIFGPPRSTDATATEETALRPVSPYGEAKAAAHRAVQGARSSGLCATNLVLFGHTSPLHGPRFVLPTICRQAAEVAAGRRRLLSLRDPTISRDWGSARDVVRAFAAAGDRSSRADRAGDFVVATGVLHRLDEVATWALRAAGVPDPEELVTTGPGPARQHDFGGPVGDARRAGVGLGWHPEVSLREEIARMVRVEAARLDSGVDHDPAYLAPRFPEPA